MKSKQHIELSHRALVWLESRATNRGIRGCEEICISDGYVADCVAISGLTMQNEKTFSGVDRVHDEQCDDYAWIFETKVSRSDFINTFKNDNHRGSRLTPFANFHFIVSTKGLIAAAEVPEFWGLLEQRGTGLGIVKMPEYCRLDKEELHRLAYLILRGSHNRKFTLYTELISQYRQEQTTITP